MTRVIRTYWDVVPRDIWWIVFNYAIPRITIDQTWEKMETPIYYNKLSIKQARISLSNQMLTFSEWISEKIEDPLECLTDRLFGESIDPPGWSIYKLAQRVLLFQTPHTSLQKLKNSIEWKYHHLYPKYYQLWKDLLIQDPHGKSYTDRACKENYCLSFLTNERQNLSLEGQIVRSAMISGDLTILKWVEDNVSNIGFHLDRMSDLYSFRGYVIDWACNQMDGNQEFLAKIRDECMETGLTDIFARNIIGVRRNMYECHLEFLEYNNRQPNGIIESSDGLDIMKMLFDNALRDHTVTIGQWHELIQWAHEDGENHPFFHEWLVCFIRCFSLPQIYIHRLILKMIEAENSILVQFLYEEFFQIMFKYECDPEFDSDDPVGANLFYASYSSLKRSDIFSDCIDFLEPLIVTALECGLKKTRGFDWDIDSDI